MWLKSCELELLKRMETWDIKIRILKEVMTRKWFMTSLFRSSISQLKNSKTLNYGTGGVKSSKLRAWRIFIQRRVAILG